MESKAPRVCLITGAAGGIGESLVSAFADAGYSVIATDVCTPPKTLRCAHFIQADLNRVVSDESYANEIFLRIRKCFDGLGLKVLVNNAAAQIISGVESLTRDSWRNTLDVNLIAPFLLVQTFLAELEKEEGCVINISSIHAQRTKRGFVAYATSKAALSGLTRAMSMDLAGRVRVIAIEPAAIETEMLRTGFKDQPGLYKHLSRIHPLGRIGQPSEVARLALVMADGGMDFLNGVSVQIDGGIGARLCDPEM